MLHTIKISLKLFNLNTLFIKLITQELEVETREKIISFDTRGWLSTIPLAKVEDLDVGGVSVLS